MCLYMNSAVLMRENVAEKMYVRERQVQIIRLIATWFISEHRYLVTGRRLRSLIRK